MTTETIAQHKDRNFKMAENVKLTEPKESREMNKADICRELYNDAEFHQFGGSWPAASFGCLLENAG
jgi:hypothetical protein